MSSQKKGGIIGFVVVYIVSFFLLNKGFVIKGHYWQEAVIYAIFWGLIGGVVGAFLGKK